MKAPYYIVSDNHFMMQNSTSESDRRDKLFQVFNTIKKGGEGTLIIGGDFFDFWFEGNHVIPRGYQNLIQSLHDLNEAGINIHYIAGNHDYWNFGYFEKFANIKFHKGDLQFKHKNKNILITHGDGLLKNDYGYRFMKKIIRHPLFIKLFKYIPPRISYKLAKKLSKSSSDYNHNDKFINTIITDITAYAENKWEKEIDIIMVGHYHQQKIITKNEKSLVFLGDWLSKFSVTTIIDEKIWQGNWKQFIKLS